MTAAQHLTETSENISYKVMVNGEALPEKVGILSISVSMELNRVPQATIVVADGDPSENKFEWSNADFFIPGNEVEIFLGYQTQNTSVFKGVVHTQQVRVRAGGQTYLCVECRDKSMALTFTKKSRIFEEMKDSEAFEEILNVAGLTADVEATSVKHLELVQFAALDWDFIVSRAEANGMYVLPENGTVKIFKPDLNAEPVVELLFGTNILEFEGETDARTQFEKAQAETWIPENQKWETFDKDRSPVSTSGNLKPTDLAKAVENKLLNVIHGGNRPDAEMSALLESDFQRSRLAMIAGTAKINGHKDLKPGIMVKIAGVSDRLNGNSFVSAVRHELSGGIWVSLIQFGVPKRRFSETVNINHASASGMLPAVQGLHIGVVTALKGDPDGGFRIKVKIPAFSTESEGIWTRQAAVYAGNEYGHVFRPEIGDEVIIGFINNDPRDAIMLGALHSSENAQPFSDTDDNFKKGIYTKSGLKVLFDDDKKVLTLETPAGQSVLIDDDAKELSLKDANGNEIIMSKNGIEIKSNGEISLKATKDMKLSGMNIENDAQVNFKAKGAAGATLEANGNTVVKGAMVMIN